MAKISKELANKLEDSRSKYAKSMKRAMQAASQLHHKKGPIYEKYLSSMYVKIVTEMVRLGVTIPDPLELCQR